MKNQWRLIIGIFLVLIVVIFAVLNNQTVPVNFGFTQIAGPLILIILGSAILGILIGVLTSATTIWKQKKQLKEAQKSVEIYKNDADKLAQEASEKVKRSYENQLTELQEKYDRLVTSEAIEETETVGSRVEQFTKPRNTPDETDRKF